MSELKPPNNNDLTLLDERGSFYACICGTNDMRLSILALSWKLDDESMFRVHIVDDLDEDEGGTLEVPRHQLAL